jgi:hypothetical protein
MPIRSVSSLLSRNELIIECDQEAENESYLKDGD